MPPIDWKRVLLSDRWLALSSLTLGCTIATLAPGVVWAEATAGRSMANSQGSVTARSTASSPSETLETLANPSARANVSDSTQVAIDLAGDSDLESSLEPSDPMAQVTAVSQLRDVQPSDWAFQALQSLVERYGCLTGYPDRTFRGDRALSRHEFAAAVSACFDRVNALVNAKKATLAQRSDLETLRQLQTQFSQDVAMLRGRLDSLDQRTTTLEKQEFSPTVKLNGYGVIGFQGRLPNRADRQPRDGVKDISDPGANFGVISQSYLSLTSNFSSRDFLYVGFWQQKGSGDPRLTNDGRLAYDGGAFDFYLSDLNYHFLIGDKLAVMIGTEGVYTSLAFRGPNRVEGSFTGPLSFFAQRNPILDIGFGRAGVAFDWQVAKRASLQGFYSSSIPGFFPNSVGGKGNNTFGFQLALTPIDPVDVAIYYINDYSPNGALQSLVGDDQLTAINPATGTSASTRTHAIGTSIDWQINPTLELGGWFGYTNSHIPGESGTVATTNYMVYLNFLDLFGKGNLGGIYFGQPPKIIHSTLPAGNNLPDLLNTGLGLPGGQPGTTWHLETFYRWQVNDHFSLTPGVIVNFHPGHTPDSDTIVTPVLRAAFAF